MVGRLAVEVVKVVTGWEKICVVLVEETETAVVEIRDGKVGSPDGRVVEVVNTAAEEVAGGCHSAVPKILPLPGNLRGLTAGAAAAARAA